MSESLIRQSRKWIEQSVPCPASKIWHDESSKIRTLLVANLLPTLEWRRHANGVLQAYIQTGEATRDLRVHVWHRSLKKPGRDEELTHNHRYCFDSYVLNGAVTNVQYILTEHPEGDWRTFPMGNSEHPDGRGVGEASKERYKVETYPVTIKAGDAYTFDRWAYHFSDAQDYSVTLVERWNRSPEKSRSIVPLGHTPEDGILDHTTEVPFQPILEEARQQMLRRACSLT